MNRKKSKLIHKLIYRGEKERLEKTYKTLEGGQVMSSVYRCVYQDAKKECRDMTMGQIKEHLAPTKIGGLRGK